MDQVNPEAPPSRIECGISGPQLQMWIEMEQAVESMAPGLLDASYAFYSQADENALAWLCQMKWPNEVELAAFARVRNNLFVTLKPPHSQRACTTHFLAGNYGQSQYFSSDCCSAHRAQVFESDLLPDPETQCRADLYASDVPLELSFPLEAENSVPRLTCCMRWIFEDEKCPFREFVLSPLYNIRLYRIKSIKDGDAISSSSQMPKIHVQAFVDPEPLVSLEQQLSLMKALHDRYFRFESKRASCIHCSFCHPSFIGIVAHSQPYLERNKTDGTWIQKQRYELSLSNVPKPMRRILKTEEEMCYDSCGLSFSSLLRPIFENNQGFTFEQVANALRQRVFCHQGRSAQWVYRNVVKQILKTAVKRVQKNNPIEHLFTEQQKLEMEDKAQLEDETDYVMGCYNSMIRDRFHCIFLLSEFRKALEDFQWRELSTYYGLENVPVCFYPSHQAAARKNEE